MIALLGCIRTRRALRPVAATLASVVACAVLVAGGQARADAAAPTPVSGGTVTLGWTSSPNCLDPQLANASLDLSIARQFVDSLVDQDPKTGDIVPWLATKWTVNTDATKFTFFLRKGVTFSDGSPLTASVVKANFNSISQLGALALGSAYLTGYTGVYVENPYEFTVIFSAPNAQFLQGATTMSLGIVSLATLQNSTASRCQGNFSASGPFTLGSFTANQQVTIVKRPDYKWGAADFVSQGAAYLDKIVFQVIPDPSVRIGALQSGQVNGITDVAPQDEPALKAGGFQIVARNNPGIPYNMTINTQTVPQAVREALEVAIDRKTITKTVLTPTYRVATGVLAENTPDYINQSSSPQMAYNPDLAKKILTQAGWVPGSDGIRTKNGQRLTVTLTYTNLFSANVPTFELLQQQYQAVGIDFETLPLPVAQFVTNLNSQNYQMIWYGQTRADPDVLRQVFSMKQLNRANLKTAGTLEDLLQQQASTTDKAKRADLVKQIQNRLLNAGYLVPIFDQTTVLAASPKVHNLKFEASSRLQLHDMWIEH